MKDREEEDPQFCLPQTFVCTVTPEESFDRTLVANLSTGVSFHPERTIDGRIVGVTEVVDADSLLSFNSLLKSLHTTQGNPQAGHCSQ